MKTRRLLLLVSLAVSPLFADTPPADAAKPCRYKTCEMSITLGQFPSFAMKHMLLTLDSAWIKANGPQMIESFADACSRHNDCLMTPGNDFAFCDEILAVEALASCDSRFPKDKSYKDWGQCRMFVATWALSVDQRAPDVWRKAQECGKQQPARAHKTLKTSITPAALSADKEIEISVVATDAETNIPIYGRIKFDDEAPWSRADPSGKAETFYKFNYRLKPVRERGADGLYRTRWPKLTVNAPHHPQTVVEYEAPPLPQLTVAVAEVPSRVKAGKNTLVVTAKDTVTGKSAGGFVIGEDGFSLGPLGQKITVTAKKSGKRNCLPKMWVRADRYSDTPVAFPPPLRCE